MKLKGKIIECDIKSFNSKGAGFTRYGDRDVAIYNALPGERVKAYIYKQRRNISHGVADEVLKASEIRCPPKEDHFLSCSPLQIISLEEENKWKKESSRNILIESTGRDFDDISLVSPQERFGYRNKMEFSFTEHEGEVSLAFFKRGTKRRYPIDGCILASEAINKSAKKILDWIRKHDIDQRALKAVIIRSNMKNEAIAGLFIKLEDFVPQYELSLDSVLKGFEVYYSNPKSPASIVTRTLYSWGDTSLSENICGKMLKFGIMSFFQVNIPVFSKTLENMKQFMIGEDVLDYYSGVGAISIATSDVVRSSILVDNNEQSIYYAKKNIVNNSLSDFSAYCDKAEKILEYIQPSKVLILDPPRSGLHPKVLKKVLREKPKRIIYLSCNIANCAKDLKYFLPYYSIKFQELYNYFPASVHVEFLVVLDLQ